MKTPLILAAAVAVGLLASARSEAAPQWGSSGHHAAAAISGTDMIAGVVFDPELGCDIAALVVSGMQFTSAWQLEIDAQSFAPAAVTIDTGPEASDPIQGLFLSDPALGALKHGRIAYLHTDIGSLIITLRGSAAAINRAWAACERQAGKPTGEQATPAVLPSGGGWL